MAGLSDLCFDPRIEFSLSVSQRFGCSVSPSPLLSTLAFLLVASFGRSTVRLNVDSVGLILQACLGGIAKDFRVYHLSGWMFRFSVSCKNVGLMIYKLKSYSCKTFVVLFHLWSGGGPNWRKEYDLWRHEQESKWTTVGSRFKKSFAEVVRSPKKSVFLRLNYPKDYGASLLDQSFSTKQTHSTNHLPKGFNHILDFDQALKRQPKQSRVLR